MSQSLSQMWIHIIFSTKNRHPFLNDLIIQQRMHDYIKAICKKQNCETVAVGGTEDHVHVLTRLHKNISLSKLVEEVKKSSSRWVKTLNDDPMLQQFYWQSGYGAFSVSQSNLEIVRLYIKNQRQHHQKQNFQEELIKFLMQHHIAYEEKYLWD